MQIFCLFHFCILYRVGTAVFRNFLSVYLLAFLLFAIVYVFACLPYFFQWFYALINCFLLSNYSHLYFLLFCRLLPVPLLRFEWLLVHAFSFLLLKQTVYYFYFAAYSFFCLVSAFLDVCFGSFRACCFCYAKQLATSICACSFSFYLAPLLIFFASSLLIHIHTVPQTSCHP